MAVANQRSFPAVSDASSLAEGKEVGVMLDLIFLAAIALTFALAVVYVQACERLK